jgi:hypothetical protein
MDGGESTSSTTSSVQTTFEQPLILQKQELNEKDNNNNNDFIIEEDDLASVLSIDSNTTIENEQLQKQQNVLLNSPQFNNLSSTLGICRINTELARSLAPEQKDLFKIWEQQVEINIETICKIIEEFFILLEENKEPTNAGFQKIQMVFLIFFKLKYKF